MAQNASKKTSRRAKIIAGVIVAACAVAIAVFAMPATVAPSSQAASKGGGQLDLSHVVPSTVDTVVNYESDDPEVQEVLERVDQGDDPVAYEPGTVLVSLAEGVSQDQALAQLNETPELSGITVVKDLDDYIKLKLPSTTTVEDALGALYASDVVGAAQPNYRYYLADELTQQEAADASLQNTAGVSSERLIAGTPFGDSLGVQASNPNDPMYGEQWGLKSINAPEAWKHLAEKGITQKNANVTVAVLDAGFLTTHEDFQGNLAGTYNAVEGRSPINPGDSTDEKSLKHGTHCAGIVGAVSNNKKGIAGAVNNICRVFPVQVADKQGTIKSEYIKQAYNYIVGNMSSNKVRVVSMSIGGGTSSPVTEYSPDQMMYDSIQRARDNGILTVVAACNEDATYTPPFYAWPSDYKNVVSVINIDRSLKRKSSSNYNKGDQRAKNISAPGTDIWSLSGMGDSLYREDTGTSMATPMVAAVVGLMFASNPNYTSDEVESRLYSSAKDIGASGWDSETGHGEVDAQAAVVDGPYLSGNSSLSINGNTKGSTTLVVKIAGKTQAASDYYWSSNNTRVATVDSNGKVTAVSAGQAVITATKKGDGSKTAKQTVFVTQTNKPVSSLSISNPATQTYNGYARTPGVTVRDGGTTLTVNKHYKLSYSNNINAGTATVKITGVSPYYSGSVSKTFRINKASLSKANISLSATSFSYDGKPHSPTVTVRDIGRNSGSNITGTCNVVRGSVILGTGRVAVTAKSNCRNFTGTVTRTFSVSVKRVTMYRLYNPNSGEHLYTASAAERNNLVRIGWRAEGTAWIAPSSSTIPVYRLYNPNNGDHHYTLSSAERDYLASIGWRYEGVSWYSYGASTSKPLYRLFNPNLQAGSHHYTTSASERDYLVSIGWRGEGVGWYAV